ncbi:hypothetical protein [Plesiocystis pacifica]|nr:hypothetical protein [Plesiocystis pacifica]
MFRERMSFSIARTSSAALAACVWLVACGPAAKPEQANRVSDAEREAMRADAEKEKAAKAKAKAKAGPPRWLRAGPSFPEAFAPFPVPDLQTIEGTWLVPSEVEGQRELWLAEAPQPAPKVEGARVAKVVVVDRRGREQVHGVTLQSPCAVQVTNEYGRSRPRALWVGEGKLHLSPGGAVAIEGSAATASADAASPLRPVLACSGNRAYVFEGEGCKRYSQMLGVWDATDVDCRRDGEALVIDDLRLEPAGAGVWMDPAAATATATAFADRGAAETALSAAPKASAEAGETAGTEVGSDGAVDPAETAGSETTGS